MEYSVVVPALDERANLEILLPELIRTGDACGADYEVLIVDSDSGDGTREFVKSFGRPEIKYLNEPVRGNLAKAWQRGISAAASGRIVTMDADLCHDPAFVPLLAGALDDADMAIASRYLSTGRSMKSKRFRFEMISRAGQWLSQSALGLPYRDMSHGFRAFKRSAYDEVIARVSSQGNAFMLDFTYAMHAEGLKIIEVPCSYGARVNGREKLNVPVETARFMTFIIRRRMGR